MTTKRILSALIALVMTVPMFLTGCQKKADDIDSETSIRQNITLNMYILTEEETDPEQAKAVQMALNEILLPDYKTTVKINYLTEDNYWSEIDKMEAETKLYREEQEAKEKAEKEAAKLANIGGNKQEKEEEIDAEELEAEIDAEYNELIDQVFEQDDIVLENPQIDIFLVNSPEKYKELIEDERIIAIDSYMALNAKTIKSYIYPTFFTGAKLGTLSTYGIPNNKVIGEYEYLVFNKELLDKYGYSSENMKTLDSLAEYLAVIASREPGVVPLAHAAGPQFFEYYGEEGSALGLTNSQIIMSAFSEKADETVKNHFKTIRRYKQAGYIPNDYTDGTKFAVDIRKGYADSPEIWSVQDNTEYVCEIYKRPVAKTDNTIDSVFVVSSESRNPQRAVEVITYLTTDPKLVNTLQYGIQDTHYYYNRETKKVKVNPNGGYYMNENYTGNQYIKYVLDGEENRLEAYKQQNLDSLVSLYYGYVPELTLTDELILEKANEIAKSYYPGLVAGVYDVDSVFAQINNMLESIDVSATVAQMLEENPELMNERYIYSYDEVKVDPEEEEVVEETAPATEETTEETTNEVTEETDETVTEEVVEEPVEEVVIEIEREESNEREFSSAFAKMVFTVDDLFYQFICEPGATEILTLQAVTAKHYNIENQNNVEEKKTKNELKELNVEEEESKYITTIVE